MKKNLHKYNWLIFDADNTLFDYDQAEKNALLKTLNDFQIGFDKDTIVETYHKINHKLWMDFEKGLIKSQAEIKLKRTRQLFDVLNVESNVENFAEDYLFNLSNNGQLLNNALKVIKELANKHRLIIMTNGMTSVQKPRFRASPLNQYFQYTIISEEIKHSKPSTKIYDHAFGLMNNPEKHEVLMIGDNLGSDIQGGLNYGIDTVWYNPMMLKKHHQATYEIHDLMNFIE